jgi:hypothetical protein
MTFKKVSALLSRTAFATLLTVCLVITGCGRKAIPKVPEDSQAFETASSDLKDAWDKAVSAARTDDYATAILICHKLQMRAELTAQQRAAVIDTITAENNRLLDGLKNNDPKAIQANETVLKGWNNRNDLSN